MAKKKGTKKITLKSNNNSINKHVGMKLRQKRTLLGLSQEGLGKILNITFQQVQKYESGITKISVVRLLDICDIFKVPLSYFFEGFVTEDGKKVPALNDDKTAFKQNTVSLDKKALELVKLFYGIKNPRVAKQVFALVKSISEQEDFSVQDEETEES